MKSEKIEPRHKFEWPRPEVIKALSRDVPELY
jgi:hypothetical protein